MHTIIQVSKNMELQIFLSLATFLFFLVLLFRTLACSKGKRIISLTTKGNLPPGPRKLPIIGNLHNLIGRKLQHRALGELAKKNGPLMHLKLGRMSIVVVSSPKMAEEVMKRHDLTFAERPELLVTKMLSNAGTDIVSAPYGDYWRQMKKLCVLELLSTRRVQSFSSLREEEAWNLVESIQSSCGESASALINVSEKIYTFTSNMICRAAFGNKCEDQTAFIRLTNQFLSLAGGFTLSEMFPTMKFLHIVNGMKGEVVKVHKEVEKILDNIIHEHEEKLKSTKCDKQWEKEDLVDVLLRLRNSGSLEVPLSIDDVKAVVWGMFIGGTDTSATTATWAMSEMMRNPTVLEKAQAEFQESAGKTERLLDMKYPSKLKFNVWAIGRDPKYWEDPESFVPERFSESSIDFKGNNFEFTPFGAGRRMCPGLSFGMHNLELPLAQMLYHFNWELPNGMKPEELDMTKVFGPIVARKNDLYLVAGPYTS